jgi:diguanylate cyclase (GGDEF)-like protein
VLGATAAVAVATLAVGGGDPTWAQAPTVGAGGVLALVGYATHRRLLGRAIDRAVENARQDLVRELAGRGAAAPSAPGSQDPLTGLPDRAELLRLAAEAVAAAGPLNPLSVLVLDLDRFKDVNDSLGHAVGDRLLGQVGPRLRAALRPSDTIARLGGDEFAVLLPTAGEDGARTVAGRLADALDSPFDVDGMVLHVEASIGIAVSHRDERTETTHVEGLLREADIAMYRAKGEGSGIVQFDPERDAAQGRSRLQLSSQLRRAITGGELVLHYQPLVDVCEGRLAGVEALVRWQHPEQGLLPPGVFLPLAESTGMIVPLSRLVLASAIAQAASWNRAGYPVAIAVNLSPRLLQNADVPQVVTELLGEHDVPPELIRLEITESVVLAHPELALSQLEQLREMGIGLSLDDFGTGYSSMTHLRHLPVDELKVDRAFVHAMTTSQQDAVIVRAAVELGHNLGMHVVAEGIEDADTLAEVVSAGCSLAQGYYFSRPLPPEDLIAWTVDRFPEFGTATGEPAVRRVAVGT